MRVLWFSHLVPYPPKGGVVQRSYNLIRQVSEKHEVCLVAFNQKALLPTEERIEEARQALSKVCSRVEILRIPSDRSRLARLGLVLSSVFTRSPYSANWLKSRAMADTLFRILRKEHFDLIHVGNIGLASFYPHLSDVPKVLNHNDIESFMMKRRATKEKNLAKRAYFFLESKKLENYERQFGPKFDAHLTVSTLDRDRLLSVSSALRPEVIANGVDTEYFQPSEGPVRKRSLVFAGGLTWYPNKDAMIYFCGTIWPIVKRVLPDVSLTIVGRESPNALKRLSLEDRAVRLTGYVDDVRPYLNEAEVYICPIRDGGGTRLKILDALAMGKAIVSTSLGCEGIDVEPERHIVIGDNAPQFAAQIVRLLSDKELRARLGREGRKLVEGRYSWPLIGNQLKRLYEEVVQERLLNKRHGHDF